MALPKLPTAGFQKPPSGGNAGQGALSPVGPAKEIKTEDFVAANVYAHPPVTLRMVKTFTFREYNRNTYWRDYEADVAKGQVRLEPSELSFLGRGHSYTCRFLSGPPFVAAQGLPGTGYLIRSLRLCDEETVPLLEGLAFLHGDEGVRTGKWADQANQVKALDFSFCLTPIDFPVFRERVIAQGGRVRSNEVQEAEVRQVYADLMEGINEVGSLYSDLLVRTQQLSAGAGVAACELVLQDIDDVEAAARDISQLHYTFSTLVEQASLQGAAPRLVTIYAALRQTVSDAARVKPTTMMPFSELRKVVQVRLGAALQKTPIVGPVLSLATELLRLRELFPVLSKVQATTNDSLLITVDGGTLLLSTQRIQLNMSPEMVQQLLGGIPLHGPPSGGGRFGEI